MTAVFVQPKSFTVSAASAATTGPADNMNLDSPGLVWRSNGLSGVFATVQLDGNAYDTIALVDSNLRATDTIQIRAGASAAAVAGTTGLTLNQTINAYSGTAPYSGTISVLLLAASITSPFVRIDITSTGNPAGYVQAQRLVIGQRVAADGLDIGAEWTPEDDSDIQEGAGFTTINPYGVRVSLKMTMSNIKESDYWTKWFPFFMSVGQKNGFLCIPDTDPTYLQNQSQFGRVSTNAKGTTASSDLLTMELTMKSVS